MTMREWMDHRQAYVPRLWPMALAGVFVALAWGAIVYALALRSPMLGFLIGFGGGGLLGWGLMQLRWKIWRRRHPELSTEEHMALISRRNTEAAPWN
jgi:hypothetical protein